jgi:hypothetical protein
MSETLRLLSAARDFPMLICFSVKTRLRPPFLPLALAASSPALVRSRIKSRSNSAIAFGTSEADRTKHMKNQSAAAGGSIQALLNAFEPNAPITQSPHDFDEVSQRAT